MENNKAARELIMRLYARATSPKGGEKLLHVARYLRGAK